MAGPTCNLAEGARYRPSPPPSPRHVPPKNEMQRTPSKPRAALWMSGWLVLLLTITIAGREGLREVSVFQVTELRSVIAFCILLPIIQFTGGFAAMKTARLGTHVTRNLIHYGAQLGWFFAL